MSLFTSLPGKCLSLAEPITDSNQISLFLNGQTLLLNQLLPDKFTYMQITDGSNCEFVRVEPNSSGTGLVITSRGEDGSQASTFTKGAKVFFTWTETALDAFLTCRASSVEEDAPIKIPGYTAVFDEELQQWCYEPDEGTNAEEICWTVGKIKYTFADGVVTTEQVAVPGLVPGTYNNATVTIDDNCELKSVVEGDKPLYTPSVKDDCCKDNEPDPSEKVEDYLITLGQG